MGRMMKEIKGLLYLPSSFPASHKKPFFSPLPPLLDAWSLPAGLAQGDGGEKGKWISSTFSKEG